MLGKTIYVVEGFRDFNVFVHRFYFDTQHEAEAFRDKATDERLPGMSWYVEAMHIYTHSDDALRALRS